MQRHKRFRFSAVTEIATIQKENVLGVKKQFEPLAGILDACVKFGCRHNKNVLESKKKMLPLRSPIELVERSAV